MNKEKLIEVVANQENGLDERETLIKDHSYRWGFWGVYLVLAVISLFRLIKGIDFTFDLVMIMMSQSGFMSLSLYKSGRNKKMNLVFSITSLVLFLVATYITLINYEII